MKFLQRFFSQTFHSRSSFVVIFIVYIYSSDGISRMESKTRLRLPRTIDSKRRWCLDQFVFLDPIGSHSLQMMQRRGVRNRDRNLSRVDSTFTVPRRFMNMHLFSRFIVQRRCTRMRGMCTCENQPAHVLRLILI